MVNGDDLLVNSMEIDKMKDEYNKLQRVDHKNIIKVYGFGKSYMTKVNNK